MSLVDWPYSPSTDETEIVEDVVPRLFPEQQDPDLSIVCLRARDGMILVKSKPFRDVMSGFLAHPSFLDGDWGPSRENPNTIILLICWHSRNHFDRLAPNYEGIEFLLEPLEPLLTWPPTINSIPADPPFQYLGSSLLHVLELNIWNIPPEIDPTKNMRYAMPFGRLDYLMYCINWDETKQVYLKDCVSAWRGWAEDPLEEVDEDGVPMQTILAYKRHIFLFQWASEENEARFKNPEVPSNYSKKPLVALQHTSEDEDEDEGANTKSVYEDNFLSVQAQFEDGGMEVEKYHVKPYPFVPSDHLERYVESEYFLSRWPDVKHVEDEPDQEVEKDEGIDEDEEIEEGGGGGRPF